VGKVVEGSKGPYRGKPTLTGVGEGGFVIDVRDGAGNVIKYVPATPRSTNAIVNTGGAGLISHLGIGPTRMGGFFATGSDKGLYHIVSNGSQ
jgi:hypothetical protein